MFLFLFMFFVDFSRKFPSLTFIFLSHEFYTSFPSVSPTIAFFYFFIFTSFLDHFINAWCDCPGRRGKPISCSETARGSYMLRGTCATLCKSVSQLIITTYICVRLWLVRCDVIGEKRRGEEWEICTKQLTFSPTLLFLFLLSRPTFSRQPLSLPSSGCQLFRHTRWNVFVPSLGWAHKWKSKE